MLVPPEKSGNDRGVYLTQKDIGEVQLAKAAIAAGIFLLMKRLEITEKDIKRVYLAGAFGKCGSDRDVPGRTAAQDTAGGKCGRRRCKDRASE